MSTSLRKDSLGNKGATDPVRKGSGEKKVKHFSVFADSSTGVLFQLEEDDTRTDQQQLAELRRRIAKHFKKPSSFVLTTHSGVLITSRQQIKEGQTLLFTDKQTLPLPIGPKPIPILGNLHQLQPIMSLKVAEFADMYGPIFPLHFGKTKKWIIADADYVEKLLHMPRPMEGGFNAILETVVPVCGKSLATVSSDTEDWMKFHKRMIPWFSPTTMAKNLTKLAAKAEEMVDWWDDFADSGQEVDVLYWVRCAVFDMMGLFILDHDFSTLSEENPIMDASNELLLLIVSRFAKSLVSDKLNFIGEKKFQKVKNTVIEGLRTLVAERRKQVENSKDPDLEFDPFVMQIRSGMSDDEITREDAALLCIGLENLYATISWMVYKFATDPVLAERARQEVDRVIGPKEAPTTQKELNELVYLEQVQKEVLRHYPPPAIGDRLTREQVQIGPYVFPPYSGFGLDLHSLHFDERHWGPHPQRFDPDNFTPDRESKRHPYAWLPFGMGDPACLGRGFAFVFAKLITAAILKRFQLQMAPKAEVTIAQATATRPVGLNVLLFERPPEVQLVTPGSSPGSPSSPGRANPLAAKMSLASNPKTLSRTRQSTKKGLLHQSTIRQTKKSPSLKVQPIVILWGGETGTCEGYAQKLSKVYRPMTEDISVMQLDAVAGAESLTNFKKHLVIIVCSTYNGQPPYNAKKFDQWISKQKDSKLLQRMKFAVFGVGSKSWRTFQAFPRKVNQRFIELGASPLSTLAEGDVTTNCEDKFNEWMEAVAFIIRKTPLNRPTLPSFTEKSSFLRIKLYEEIPPKGVLAPGFFEKSFESKVILHRPLNPPNLPVINHIEFALPDNVTYKTGYHLGVCPRNDPALVEKYASLLNVNLDHYIEIAIDERANLADISKSSANLWTVPKLYKLRTLFSDIIDLSAIPSRYMLRVLASNCVSPRDQAKLKEFTELEDEEFIRQTKDQFLLVADLMERTPSLSLPLKTFIEMMPKLKVRFYSISSSPLVYPKAAHISVGLIEHKTESKVFKGVSSSYLSSLTSGSANIFVKSSEHFVLPEKNMPIILIAAGTGLAPFRGFLQERRALKHLNTTWLYFGCRTEEDGYIYKDELQDYIKDGTLAGLQLACSRSGPSRVYVQDKLYEDKDKIWKMITKDKAMVYVCGNARGMAAQVFDTFVKMAQENLKLSVDDAQKYVDNLRSNDTYLEDVWG